MWSEAHAMFVGEWVETSQRIEHRIGINAGLPHAVAMCHVLVTLPGTVLTLVEIFAERARWVGPFQYVVENTLGLRVPHLLHRIEKITDRHCDRLIVRGNESHESILVIEML